ncbi:MAG: alpha/beta hydrolase [Acidimicrobiales bacterium]
MTSEAAVAFHDLLRALPPSEGSSIEESRLASESWSLVTAHPAGVSFQDIAAGGVRAQWVLPQDADHDKVLVYLHGGGYQVGSISSHRKLVGHLARSAGVAGLCLGYRLAPENPFPAALNDVVAAFEWLLGSGYAPQRIAIGGDSAGGGLALGAAVEMARAGLPAPGGLVLLSPWTDLELTGESLIKNLSRDLVLVRDSPRVPDVRRYAGSHDLTDPRISPLYASFEGYVPFIVHVGGDEVLLDDSTRLFERALADGCDATIEVWPGMQHVFQIAAGNVPEADASIASLGRWLKARLGSRRAP